MGRDLHRLNAALRSAYAEMLRSVPLQRTGPGCPLRIRGGVPISHLLLIARELSAPRTRRCFDGRALDADHPQVRSECTEILQRPAAASVRPSRLLRVREMLWATSAAWSRRRSPLRVRGDAPPSQPPTRPATESAPRGDAPNLRPPGRTTTRPLRVRGDASMVYCNGGSAPRRPGSLRVRGDVPMNGRRTR